MWSIYEGTLDVDNKTEAPSAYRDSDWRWCMLPIGKSLLSDSVSVSFDVRNVNLYDITRYAGVAFHDIIGQ